MNYLKNVKLNHDERRDIDYVQDVEIVDRLPKIEEEFEGCVVGSIDLTRVDIEETRQSDYDFYDICLFDANNYMNDITFYDGKGVNKDDYLSEKIIAIKKEEE